MQLVRSTHASFAKVRLTKTRSINADPSSYPLPSMYRRSATTSQKGDRINELETFPAADSPGLSGMTIPMRPLPGDLEPAYFLPQLLRFAFTFFPGHQIPTHI